MKNKIIAAVFLGILLTCTFSGCVTSTVVRFNTDVEGAEVIVDGYKIGTTPTQYKMSNAFWEDPDVTIKKEGFKDINLGVKKEVKVVNVVTGVALSPVTWFIPLLWCYGPKQNQNFMLVPEKN